MIENDCKKSTAAAELEVVVVGIPLVVKSWSVNSDNKLGKEVLGSYCSSFGWLVEKVAEAAETLWIGIGIGSNLKRTEMRNRHCRTYLRKDLREEHWEEPVVVVVACSVVVVDWDGYKDQETVYTIAEVVVADVKGHCYSKMTNSSTDPNCDAGNFPDSCFPLHFLDLDSIFVGWAVAEEVGVTMKG